MRRRLVWLATIAIAVVLAGWVVPDIIARQTQAEADTCEELTGDRDRCVFVGAPLRMAGEAVFVDKFDHAFLATDNVLEFVDANGMRWTAPRRTLTDGASIPTIFETIVGDRQRREFLLAAALHDAYCGVGNEALETYQTRAWHEVHRMFYEALIASDTPPAKAKAMFAAVYLGGPRWDDPDRSLEDVPEEVLLQEMEWCLEWIEQKDPGIARIEEWMREREALLQAGTAERPAVLDGT